MQMEIFYSNSAFYINILTCCGTEIFRYIQNMLCAPLDISIFLQFVSALA